MSERLINNLQENVIELGLFGSQTWENFRILSQSYWYPTEKGERAFAEVIRSWGMLSFLVGLIILLVGINGCANFWTGYIVNIVIEEKNLTLYVHTLGISSLLMIMIAVLGWLSEWVRKEISFNWYQWLSHNFLKQYLSRGAFYQLNFQTGFYNPHRFLESDIEIFTKDCLIFLKNFLEKVLQMATFIIILWTISQQIAIYLLIYTIFSQILDIYLTRKLKQIKKKEAELKTDYDQALTQVCNQGESVAFLPKEATISKLIEKKLNQVIEKAEHRVKWEKYQDIFYHVYQSVISLFSLFVVTPLLIQEQISYGEITQVSLACLIFSNAVASLINEWRTSKTLLNTIEGLATFSKTLKSLMQQKEIAGNINIIEENYLAFEKVTLKTPDHKKVIVENLSFCLQPGESLLITGPSGRGKTAILRAIIGLWTDGSGRIFSPSPKDTLFLSQSPYLTVGTLRQQLLLPDSNHQINEVQIAEILQQVNLQSTIGDLEQLDQEIPWENRLSLGEKQRLAFARILVHRPKLAILDEGTSSLDIANEAKLYQQLQQSNITFITVGYRDSLVNYHTWVLKLLENSRWQILS
ncbi:MAG: ATP-binding cassette domain-containing protein [Crocosphaera sp.]|nr:ATP-binding cassette domain-containing protein [Crocosphaera sp.]